MHKMFAKTLLAAAALAAGLSQTAHAGVADEATRATAAHTRSGQRDAFTDGARGPASEATMLPVVARQGMSVCAVRGFDPYRDGMRTRDAVADGARISSRDGFTEGARTDARERGECLS
ncbi:hypothetical protein [Cupriavidus necator]|uniref:hypothetical protein n=1 Tax=Cupriavidus necator TaxID=106590 RepID=UPI00339DA19A